MKNYEAIQQTLHELNIQIEALQEQEIKEHRAKLEEAQAKQYTFDEQGRLWRPKLGRQYN